MEFLKIQSWLLVLGVPNQGFQLANPMKYYYNNSVLISHIQDYFYTQVIIEENVKLQAKS